MKKWILLICLMIGILGCARVLTNDEIITEAKKCEDAGLKASIGVNGITGSIIAVRCVPFEETN